MIFSVRLLTLLAIAMPLATAAPQATGHTVCEATPDEAFLKVHAQMAAGEDAIMEKIESGKPALMEAAGMTPSASGKPSGLAKDAAMNFKTYFHIVQSASGTSKADGYISKQQIADQVKALNSAYALANISFTHADTFYHVNKKWANAQYPGDDIEKEMKSQTRVGGRLDLNLYYIPTWDRSGICRFPFWIGPDDANLNIDGCMSASNAFPDGTQDYRGFLTVHEVGHWFGLLHTFQGGCDENGGDYIADTAAEEGPNWSSYGCKARDSCPLLAGTDPIENHMDYSHESCKSGFTPLQAERMRSMALMYRYANN